MRRIAGIALVAALALSSVAFAALAPGPEIFDFEGFAAGTDAGRMSTSTVTFQGSDSSCTRAAAAGGHDRGVYVRVSCPPPTPTLRGIGFFRASFTVNLNSAPRSTAELFVRVAGRSDPSAAPSLVVRACGFDTHGRCPIVADRTFTQPPTDWTPVVLRDAGGESSISSVIVETTFEQLGVDDVGLSTTPQPDTEIVAGPASPTSATSADFTFAANQPGTTFTCSLDGRGLAACPAPTLSPVAIGAHTLTASAVDRWGLVDPTPATHSWTVDPAAPLQPSSAAPDPDHDGIPTPADNCPDVANPGQADADHDSVGDACELLPSGDLPPVAGRRVKLSLVSGEVFVRLPAGAALRQRGPARFGFASLAASGSAPPSGFVPLKGVASVPMGSTIDTRKGTLSVQSAATSAPPGARNRRLQAAIFSAGIFRIRQARKARSRASRSKTIPTDALLSSAPGAQNVCAGSARARPLTGVVRTLQISAKGVFRAIGGASVATGRNAIWNTTDRCDGTLTQVGRGRVTVARRSRSTRAAVVTGGRAYLVRARLFAIKKGRPR